jgi:hypothetical protein
MKRLREEKIADKRIREIEKKLFVCDVEEIIRLEVHTTSFFSISRILLSAIFSSR